jgi:hypothetical protein
MCIHILIRIGEFARSRSRDRGISVSVSSCVYKPSKNTTSFSVLCHALSEDPLHSVVGMVTLSLSRMYSYGFRPVCVRSTRSREGSWEMEMRKVLVE